MTFEVGDWIRERTVTEKNIQELTKQLNPELVAAVDRYFYRRKIAVLERLIPGEQEYKGQWRSLGLDELRQMFAEEQDDMDAYAAMFEWVRDQGASSNHPNA